MYLVELELENVRAIRHMFLDFRSSNQDQNTRRWTVLLGENGCGKSTVLKSIGLLLAGSEALPDIIGNPDQWIHNSAHYATIRGIICTVDGDEREISLQLERGDRRDDILKKNAGRLELLDAAIRKADRNYFIAGYGAFRAPPNPDDRHSYRSDRRRSAQLGTMFSTGQQLVGLEQWAMDLDYVSGPDGRDLIANSLAKLLPGMTFVGIDKGTRSVIMSTIDGDVPLRQLSEGYQAMAAWAGDLLYRMTDTFQDRKEPLSSRGVLLIDEMDIHLHPVWKRNLVDFLNTAFPNLQIISTTHSPLSVQQCGEGELFVVRREDQGPTLVPFEGDPSRLRLSELFLSPLIGLKTLDSPKVAALRSEARALELKPGAKSKAELKRLGELQQQLHGTTPLTNAEAPAFAKLMAYQRSVETPDVATRLREAQVLFGTKRVAVPTVKNSPTSTRRGLVATVLVKGRAKPVVLHYLKPTTTGDRVGAAAAKKAPAKKAVPAKKAAPAKKIAAKKPASKSIGLDTAKEAKKAAKAAPAKKAVAKKAAAVKAVAKPAAKRTAATKAAPKRAFAK